MEEYDDVVTLTNEDGTETPYVILAVVEMDGEEYAALADADEWDDDEGEEDLEVIPFRMVTGVLGDRTFFPIEDENVYNDACIVFTALFLDVEAEA